MESQKLQKRKKKKNRASLHRPHSSQLYELDETLTNEDVLFICLLENSIKSKEKNEKRKTKIDKTGSTLPCGVESLSQYSQKGQDRSLDSVCPGKATKKTKRKRKTVVIKPNSIGKISNMSDEPFKSPVKKKKKKKLAMLSKIQVSTSSSSRIKHIGPAPQNISDGKTHKHRNLEATTDPKRKSTPTDNDEISQRVRKHSLLYICTPLSSPTALPKTKRDIKHISPGKAEDMEGMSNLRQEVFIVQKQFGLTQCLTKPLDFSLASRIRAKRNILSPNDDVIEVASQSPPGKPEASKNEKVIFSFNPLKNAQNTKFIQTFLNPSYFFRKKGKSGKLNVVTPLLKINN